MHKRSTVILGALVLGAALVIAGAAGFTQTDDRPPESPLDAVSAASSANTATSLGRIGGRSLDETIAALQARLETTPGDDVSWAVLGLAYVQQARVTVNPEFYPRAEGALDESFAINADDNFLGYAGRSALASARHDFASARDLALLGLEINPFSALLYGALSDAQIQLGEYDEAFASIQRMLDLSPDTSSLSRASYSWELRGDVERATELMQRALDDAPTPADRAFALHHLGGLAFDSGDPNTALAYALSALEASPGDPAAQFGRARAEAGLGQTLTALDHYAALVRATPEPSYLIAYGTLLESVGRLDEAEEQYGVVEATQVLFRANGVLPDADAILHEIRHGDIDVALAEARRGVETRPFLAMHDALAWALHAAGHHDEALVHIERALSLGTRSALFHYHVGVIRRATGDVDGARRDLELALEINPFFHPLDAPIARQLLAELNNR